MVGSHGKSMFNLLRSCQTVFQTVCVILHYHHQSMSVPICPHPCQHLLLSVVFIIAMLGELVCLCGFCSPYFLQALSHLAQRCGTGGSLILFPQRNDGASYLPCCAPHAEYPATFVTPFPVFSL